MSLLVSLGMFACGGTVTHQSNVEEGGSGGTAGAEMIGAGEAGPGGSSFAGNFHGGGTPAYGGTPAWGGTPAYGGTPAWGGTGAMGGAHCTSPKLDPVSGLVVCAEGYTHRPKAVTCEAVGGAAWDNAEAGAGGEAGLPRADGDRTHFCSSDDDCRQYELGYCAPANAVGPAHCASGCITDSDCGDARVCTCDGATNHGGVCQYVEGCRTDADCGAHSLCASYAGACGQAGFACLSPQDECRSSADCAAPGSCGLFVDSLDEDTRITYRACSAIACDSR